MFEKLQKKLAHLGELNHVNQLSEAKQSPIRDFNRFNRQNESLEARANVDGDEAAPACWPQLGAAVIQRRPNRPPGPVHAVLPSGKARTGWSDIKRKVVETYEASRQVRMAS
jgi:hypothetical protein